MSAYAQEAYLQSVHHSALFKLVFAARAISSWHSYALNYEIRLRISGALTSGRVRALGEPERGQGRLKMFRECQDKRTKRIRMNNDVCEHWLALKVMVTSPQTVNLLLIFWP